jgi:amylosucrase
VSFQSAGAGEFHGINGMTASLVGLETAADEAAEDRAIDRIARLYGIAFAVEGAPMIHMGSRM